MNLTEQLSAAHSRANANLILEYVLADKRRVPELLAVFRDGELRIAQRAAMVVGDLGRKRPDWYLPHHEELIAEADRYRHPAMPRNVMRYFSELPLAKVKEAHQGPLLDVAFRLTEDQEVPVGIRVFAMTIVYHFCEQYPELKDELRGIIELTIEEGTTPGFRSRGNKILRWLGR